MSDKVLMKGNEAIAEAAIQAGCRHYFGYPITPQTEIAAYMAKRMPKIGGTFLQAESEVAAINMVYGTSSAGFRVMTSSSSPGISLKSEGISYIAGADLPAFIVNVQRGGPGLGGIQPSQSDYFQATRGGGHGDGDGQVDEPADGRGGEAERAAPRGGGEPEREGGHERDARQRHRDAGEEGEGEEGGPGGVGAGGGEEGFHQNSQCPVART